VHHATRYASWLVRKHRGATGTKGRALDQVVRELLLLQSSDWPFILHTGTASGYALARLQAHDHRMRRLAHFVEHDVKTNEDAKWLDDVCARDNFLWQLGSETLRAPFDA
jgi:1,4-alpha-glucan branching enzyme